MFIIIAEILLFVLYLSLYRLMLYLSRAKSRVISSWMNALWVPLFALLSFTYVITAIGVSPWRAHFAPVLALLHELGLDDIKTIKKQDLELLSSTAKMFSGAVYTFLMSWLSVTVLRKFENDFNNSDVSRTSEYQSAMEVCFLFLRALVYLIATFVLMQTLDLRHLANSLFATGAVGALLVSFAARDSISNIFGGVMILMDRPFKVGDYISSPDRNIEGTVERIGWRMTIVRTPAKRSKYIPNCLFTTVSIENLSRMSNRRINFNVGVRYEDLKKVATICREIEALFDDVDFIDKRCGNFCTFNSLGDFSVNLYINLYTKPQSFREYNKSIEYILHEVVRIVRANHADFPFPTTTLDNSALVKQLKRRISD
jgi:small-conductance mechanosensitive channel